MASYEVYFTEIFRSMTIERAERIKHLRTTCGASYQDITILVFDQWGKDATWPKKGDKVAGEALCVVAARRLGDVPYKGFWA